ncbi:MAG: DinB family protein, partial [Acetobacteraceae bacterium]
ARREARAMTDSLIDHFRAMARNSAWSNARLLAACMKLSSAEFAATRVSFFPSLRQTMNHILIVDRAYLADLEGIGRPVEDNDIPFPESSDLARAQRQFDRELVAFCDRLRPADLDRIVAIDRHDGVEYREIVAVILSHLFVHQIHHRGQAHAMLAGTMVAPPQLDEFFLASDAPRRSAELQSLQLDGPTGFRK